MSARHRRHAPGAVRHAALRRVAPHSTLPGLEATADGRCPSDSLSASHSASVVSRQNRRSRFFQRRSFPPQIPRRNISGSADRRPAVAARHRCPYTGRCTSAAAPTDDRDRMAGHSARSSSPGGTGSWSAAAAAAAAASGHRRRRRIPNLFRIEPIYKRVVDFSRFLRFRPRGFRRAEKRRKVSTGCAMCAWSTSGNIDEPRRAAADRRRTAKCRPGRSTGHRKHGHP